MNVQLIGLALVLGAISAISLGPLLALVVSSTRAALCAYATALA
jgi:hypothetical protein